MRGRGIIVGGMVLGLLFGCNNGAIEELEKKNKFLSSLANLGNEFLNVFTSFGDMISGETLGFKAESKKSDVAKYFKKVHEKVEGTKTALNKIVENMKAENNPNVSKTKDAVTALNAKLDKIIEGAETASGAIGNDGSPLGDVAAGGGSKAGNGAKGENIGNLVKGIKDIVEVVLKDKGSAEAGTDTKNDNLGTRAGGKTTAGEAGKLFDTDADGATNAKKSAVDAAKAVGAVSGADILQAIKSGGDAVKLADGTATGSDAKKDAAIAGGIALRAMVKGGKFANANDSPTVEVVATVKGAAVSAVTKALDTLTIAIRKTIDEELKKVKEAMNISPEITPVTTEAKNQ